MLSIITKCRSSRSFFDEEEGRASRVRVDPGADRRHRDRRSDAARASVDVLSTVANSI